ncbi:MAG TPA: RnfABCDGE type electron transport complex subunit D [Sedimentisphaerales bacterium]|nr:RnfABCDGE type electron transport complex subunit D [Sedimentisphaerales bacterium]
MLSQITVSPAPHISKPLSTRSVMIDVVIGLVPAMITAGYYFRIHAFILIPTCVVSAVITEWLCNVIRRKSNPLESLGDFSAVVTGIILALSVPPVLPVWAAVIGSGFAIAIGKMVFGGLGANIFNPAMAGRAFLTASFGMLMTTWTVPATIDAKMPRISADNMLDTRTQATPLALSKQAQKARTGADALNEQLRAAFTGEVGGCLGETSALALLIGGIYLLARRTISFHIPLAVTLSAFVFSGVAYLINTQAYASPVFHLCSGGLLIGAFFIATDPVTAPLTTRGMWIFGIGVGTVTMLIRIVGEYPEGVMYSVLLMNAVTPLIDRFCKLIPAGGRPHV